MRIDFIKHNIFSPAPILSSAGSKSPAKTANADNCAKNLFMNELSVIQNYNIPFLGKTTSRPVYAIDRQKNRTWFASANKASAALGISNPSILKCIKDDKDKRAKYAGDYCFVLACEVEILKDDGTVEIDEEKINKIFEAAEIARTEGANVKKHRFYGMNKEHIPIPFSSFTEAEKITSATRPNIIRCLNGDNKTACGYIFFEPEEIEIIDDKGNVNFDTDKLDMLIKRADDYLANPYIAEKMPVYALYIGDDDKEDIRFDTITKAIKELKISHRSINACLSGDSDFAGDYCFALASDIETVKEDGTVDINNEKINELKKKAKIASSNNTCVKGKAVIAIKMEDNSRKRYDISADAAHALDISPANISTCLAGRKKSTNGYIFIPAYKVEVKDENGVIKVDEEKLKTALKELDESVAAYKAKVAEKKGKTKNPKDTKKKPETSSKNKNINDIPHENAASAEKEIDKPDASSLCALPLADVNPNCKEEILISKSNPDPEHKIEYAVSLECDADEINKFSADAYTPTALLPETVPASAPVSIPSMPLGLPCKPAPAPKTIDELKFNAIDSLSAPAHALLPALPFKPLSDFISDSAPKPLSIPSMPLGLPCKPAPAPKTIDELKFNAIDSLSAPAPALLPALPFKPLSDFISDSAVEPALELDFAPAIEQSVPKTAPKPQAEEKAPKELRRGVKIKTDDKKLNPEETEHKETKHKVKSKTELKTVHAPKPKAARAKDPEKLRAKYARLGRIYAFKPNGDCLEFKDLFEASEKLDVDIEELYRVIKNNSSAIKGLMFTSDSDY